MLSFYENLKDRWSDLEFKYRYTLKLSDNWCLHINWQKYNLKFPLKFQNLTYFIFIQVYFI